jgi:hypothetical protein
MNFGRRLVTSRIFGFATATILNLAFFSVADEESQLSTPGVIDGVKILKKPTIFQVDRENNNILLPRRHFCL